MSQRGFAAGSHSDNAPVEHDVDNAAAPQIQTSDADDLLAEIDGLLEENAEEFVNSYVQKGGQ